MAKLSVTLNVEVVTGDGEQVLSIDRQEHVAAQWVRDVLTDARFRECEYKGETYEVTGSKPEVFLKPFAVSKAKA